MSKFFDGLKVNRVVKYFISADLALFSGWGLVAPIFSVYVTESVPGATLVTVGAGATTYWMTRSIFQLPLGKFLDSQKTEKASLYVLLLGLVLCAISAFGFAFINSVWQFYLMQFAHGLGMALYATSWNGVFSHHLDKDKVAFEWAMNSASLGLASGLTGFLGGYIASNFGFSYVFQAAGWLSLLAAIIIFLVPDLVIPNRSKFAAHPTGDHSPKNANS